MLNWLKWLLAKREMTELERWHIEWEEHRRWFAEFPVAAFVLDRMKMVVSGEQITSIHVARDSWRAAPESKDKQDAGWIRVNDLLPASKNDVLVYCMDTNEQFVAFHCGKGEFQFALDRHGERIVCRPTYWMPLPPAPIAATAQQKEGE